MYRQVINQSNLHHLFFHRLSKSLFKKLSQYCISRASHIIDQYTKCTTPKCFKKGTCHLTLNSINPELDKHYVQKQLFTITNEIKSEMNGQLATSYLALSFQSNVNIRHQGLDNSALEIEDAKYILLWYKTSGPSLYQKKEPGLT